MLHAQRNIDMWPGQHEVCMQHLNGNKQLYFQAGKGCCICLAFKKKLFGLFVCFVVVVDFVGFFYRKFRLIALWRNFN